MMTSPKCHIYIDNYKATKQYTQLTLYDQHVEG